MTALSVGVDVGGTFTDLAGVDSSGRVTTIKVSSTPADQSVGVETALRALGRDPSTVERVVHGTTVVTNMLLERQGARVVLCATHGATDLLDLRRQERVSLYDLSAHHPAALVPREHVVAVRERIAPEGTLIPLSDDEAIRVAEAVAALDPDIVAIALLHAYANDAHEQRLARELTVRLGGRDVVRSTEVLPEIREYERTATAVCEAYVRPGVGRYVARLGERLAALGLPSPSVMSSSGGTAPAHEAARHGASLALSGPAGGVAGAAHVARALGITRALSIDIGGTSADVGLVIDGEPLVEAGGAVAGVPIALPRVLVETVSAGGGSVAWIDDGGALRVGPRSAGANPGPVAFRRGGTQPTITDAHIALGNIRAGRMSDGVELDLDSACAAVAELARRLGAAPHRTAAAIVAAADAAMARALRRVSVERGIDPRECVLIAFGGGGPLHACGLAERLGTRRIVVPPHAGVLSALGLAIAPDRRVAAASVMRPTIALGDADYRRLASELVARADADRQVESRHPPGESRAVSWTARMRYAGQGHELDVPFDAEMPASGVDERFVRRHRERYGFALDRGIEVVSARCTVSTGARPAALGRSGPNAWADDERRDDGGELEVTVRGRASVVLSDATMLVADGWTARSLPTGGWIMEQEGVA